MDWTPYLNFTHLADWVYDPVDDVPKFCLKSTCN